MFPLQSALLPGETLPLRVFEPRYSRLVADCLGSATGDPAFGVVLIRRGSEVGGGDVRHDVGVLAHITAHTEFGAGRYEVLAAVGERIRVLQWLPDDPYPCADVEEWPDEPGPPVSHERLSAVAEGVVSLYRRIAAARGEDLPVDLLAGRIPSVAETADDPSRYLWALAARVPMGPADRYSVLAAPTLSERVEVLADAIDSVAATVEFRFSQE